MDKYSLYKELDKLEYKVKLNLKPENEEYKKCIESIKSFKNSIKLFSPYMFNFFQEKISCKLLSLDFFIQDQISLGSKKYKFQIFFLTPEHNISAIILWANTKLMAKRRFTRMSDCSITRINEILEESHLVSSII